MKRKYEKILDFFGLPKLYCYFCDTTVFLSRRGLNVHIKNEHDRLLEIEEASQK